jgi:putative membrane protein
MTSPVVDHQQTAHLLEWEIGSGQDPRVGKFAIATLPTVLDHLEMAKQIEAHLTGAG